jgi:threonine/homoserine/homoserine lactone efflux protein
LVLPIWSIWAYQQYWENLTHQHLQTGWAATKGSRIFFSALSLQLTNPKILLTFVAILPQFIDQHEAVGLQMLILAICSIIPEFFILLDTVCWQAKPAIGRHKKNMQ